MALCKCLFLLASFSPFASSSEDTAEEILAQIGCGKFVITGGNWDLVSDTAKVQFLFYFRRGDIHLHIKWCT